MLWTKIRHQVYQVLSGKVANNNNNNNMKKFTDTDKSAVFFVAFKYLIAYFLYMNLKFEI